MDKREKSGADADENIGQRTLHLGLFKNLSNRDDGLLPDMGIGRATSRKWIID